MDLIRNGGRSSGSCWVCSVRADNAVNTELTNANLQRKNADPSIATTTAARIASLERGLTHQERLEGIMQQKFQTGTINESCYLATTAARLKLQIELRKERQ